MSSYKIISEFSTKIRNAQESRNLEVKVKKTKLIHNILVILKKEGFIRGYFFRENFIFIELKYFFDMPVINKIHPILRGNPIYSFTLKDLLERKKNILKKKKGLECFILSTSKGIMSEHDALKENLGGKILLKIL
jgi:small subunit ribosomal protein S8